MSIVLGVDLGTTKITSLALEVSSGQIPAVGTVVNDANVTSDADRRQGRSEWDVDRIVVQGIACLKQVADQLGSRISEVSGIGITGQQHGMLLTSQAGKPISPLINWQDRRALDGLFPTMGSDPLHTESVELSPHDRKGSDPFVGKSALDDIPGGAQRTWLDETRALLGEDVWQRTGCRLQPGFMAGTLFWLKANGRLPANARALFVMDHFGAILTGQPAVTEPSCAGSSGVLNVRTRQWDPEAIKALGLSMSLFPEVREANSPVGRLTEAAALATGLPAGIPIYPAIGDHQASFLGSVTDRKNSILINVGTGAQVAVFTDEFDFEPPIELRPFPCGGNLLSNVGLAGGWSYQVLEQFFRDVGRSLFQQESSVPIYEQLNQLAASVPDGADGLRCDPLFAGTRLDPTVRGTLTGLSPQNFTARHLARAVLEGMARSLRDGYSAIEKITGRLCPTKGSDPLPTVSVELLTSDQKGSDPFVGQSPTGRTRSRLIAAGNVSPRDRKVSDPFVGQSPTGRAHSRLIAAGNGLRENPLLSEIVSHSFGLPMTFTQHREEAAYGAALIAAGPLADAQ